MTPMTMTRRGAAVLALALAAGAAPRAGQVPVFSSRAEMVRIDALVTRGGQPIRGLKPENFEVRDNGVLQQVDFVSLDEAPLNVVLALDMSSSVAGARLESLRRASHAVLDELVRDDRAGLVTFGSAVMPGVALTSAFGDVKRVLDGGVGRGLTSLIDGSFAGLMLGVSETGRSLLLVFSDGVDTASWLTADAVTDAAKRGDVVAYGVVVGAAPKRSFLQDLTAATGGDLLEAKTNGDLKDAFLRLLNEYRHRYVLGYVPRDVTKAGWHRLDVRVKGQNAVIKVRPGYLAGP